jgi:hypothetical protein
MNCSSVSWRRDLKRLFISLLLCAAAIPAAHSAPQSDTKQLLERAREKYYNLRWSGLIEFQAKVKPNWKILLTGVEPNRAAMKLLDGLHFSVSLDSKSKLRVDHYADVTPVDQKSVERVDRIFRDMDEAVSRFVATWSIFMLTSPFPEVESGYEEVAGRYHFFHKEGGIDVLTITDRDFMIIEIRASGAGFNSSLRPVLEKTRKGFILRGYEASHETPSGTGNTLVDVRLDYQEVKGLQLPRKVNVNTVYDGKPAQLEYRFIDYQVTVR